MLRARGESNGDCPECPCCIRKVPKDEGELDRKGVFINTLALADMNLLLQVII